jgi:alcohol dehydrogenase (NADP+)
MSTQHFLRPISQAGRLRPIKFWKSSTIPSRQIGNYAGKTFTVNTGAQIPAIGCRTFQDEEQQEGAVLEALKAGVRLIARVYALLHFLLIFCSYMPRYNTNPHFSYDTESFIGTAIKRSSIPRDEIFLTTKL